MNSNDTQSRKIGSKDKIISSSNLAKKALNVRGMDELKNRIVWKQFRSTIVGIIAFFSLVALSLRYLDCHPLPPTMGRLKTTRIKIERWFFA